MRKFFLTLAVLVMAICANAQKNQYFWYQGNLMMGNPIAQIDSVTFGEGEPTDTLYILLPRTIIKEVHDTVYVTVHDTIKPNTEGDKTTYNGHEYVDLGLPSGTLWATCNVDAASPDQLGGYYGWGCLTPYPGTYCGNIPVSNISGTEYDVARVKWGGEWRMPTNEECLELAANCSRKDTTINGKSGIVVRGTNNNYIFIPGSGYCGEDAYVQDAGGPGFWTSTGGPTYPYRVWEWINNSYSAAAQGWQIRPVVSKTDDVISQTETISGAQIVHDTVYITIHDTVCPNEIPEGALNGVFSVAEDKKVRFAKGNLQFHMKDSIWRFADNQYEVLGEANSNCGDPSYDGFIDLFGWSTASTYFGVNTSTSNSTYNGDFVDWGVNINNGWFTLNHDEWTYLYQGRPNADNLYGMACVNGVNGCIFLPDNWQTPQGVTFNTGTHLSNDHSSYALVNNFTIEEWKTLEQNGAIFLPAAADREGLEFNTMHNTWYYGFYWTSTSNGTTSADCFVINPAELSTSGSNNRHYGDAVRLVIEVE